MATGNGIIKKLSGRVGNLIYSVRSGQQVVRGASTSVKNPRTDAQMAQRMKWANILAVYRTLRPYMKDCFETKKKGQSDYSRFMSTNLHSQPVYLEKGQARLGAGVVAPYVITQGSLPSIQVSGATPATDIALGTLTIGADTTVSEFAQAVVQNNGGYHYGDQLSFFKLNQEEDSQDGHPYISVTATRVNLDPADTSKLRDVAPASGFSTVSGTLGTDAALDGLEEHGSTQMLSVATHSYGGATDIFIRPDGTSGGSVTVNEGTGGTPGGIGGEDEGEEGTFG